MPQLVLLFGIAGAVVLRVILIALGAQLLSSSTGMFLVFGAILVATAVGVLRDAPQGGHAIDVHEPPIVRLAKRYWPVTDDYRGNRHPCLRPARPALGHRDGLPSAGRPPRGPAGSSSDGS
ncbi:MAG: TerC family protein [Ornithinimicrobium sp.]|uniref:TerC family protein n=1 Tax=Ornithinimicrobium sp. TaxID=1977084 RepID=UPI003D9AFA42